MSPLPRLREADSRGSIAAMPSVSVVIPCYNGERYLREALESALGQTRAPDEILLLDDGSIDESAEIARSFGPRVTVISQKNVGQSATRNRGIDEARGDFIAFLDADDIWLPEKIERQLRLLEATPSLDVIYTPYFSLTPDGATQPVSVPDAASIVKALRLACPIVPSTVMVRKSLVVGERFDTTLSSSEDWDFFYRLSKRGSFGVVDEPSIYYRYHPASITHRNWLSILASAQTVAKRIQADFSGMERLTLKRSVDGRLYANAAIAARDQGSPEGLFYVARSIGAWPFAGVASGRHKLLAKLALQRARGAFGTT